MSKARLHDTATHIPLLDLGAQYRDAERDIRRAIDEVCRSQHFILGPRVAELEGRIADYSGVAYGVGMSSGTDALLAALMALGVGPGQEVVTTPFSFFATAGVIVRLGARPLFCDIDPLSYNMDPACLERLLDEQCERRDGRLVNRVSGAAVTAIMPVHLFGQLADMKTIMALAGRHRLRVVEDAAQAIGAEDSAGRRAGSFGDIGCLSFFPSKNLGAFGDAGMCVTDDEALAERMRILRVHGAKPKYYHETVGGNFRLDALQAAVLLAKLPHLDGWTRARQANARRYDELLGGLGPGIGLRTPHVTPGHRHIYNQYVVRAPRRDALREHLAQDGVTTAIYYPVPLHAQACFADLGHAPDDFGVATRASAEVLALPVYPGLTESQSARVADAIAEFYR